VKYESAQAFRMAQSVDLGDVFVFDIEKARDLGEATGGPIRYRARAELAARPFEDSMSPRRCTVHGPSTRTWATPGGCSRPAPTCEPGQSWVRACGGSASARRRPEARLTQAPPRP